MEELIRRLTEAFGPSGFEEPVREMVKAAIGDAADEMRVDAMGNLIASKYGDGSGRKVMVAAHMDEIGVISTHVTKAGFLRFTGIGGLRLQTLLGARVRFAGGQLGVVYCERLPTRMTLHPLERHYIDVGAANREDCPVSVGTPGIFERSFLHVGQRYIGKSMDDRVGCAVAVAALRQLNETPHDVHFVFSVQEEVGARGALAAANMLGVDVGIAIDVTLTGDTLKGPHMAVRLGQGPAIKVKDAGMIAHRGLVRLMRRRAEEMKIAYQLEVLEGGSTDARSVQIAGAGAAAGCISIPCRYVHSQSETVHAADVDQARELLVDLLSKPLDL
ncbi:MAG: M20/M25/M40 family metallo-hydrolase [Candidatus Promineifilaceae bacterium]|nr:M20/M25/M40 family metallo-hydrolase [Candidatus Promineifilaceae bacterium]